MVDWDALIAGRVDGMGVRVLDVRVGEPIDAVAFTRAWKMSPLLTTPDAREFNAEVPGMRVSAAGAAAALTREAVLAELHAAAGRLTVGDAVFEVEGGVVRSILVRGTLLDGFGIRREDDLARHFGAPLGVEREHGARWHYFAARSLAVLWGPAEPRPWSVVLGPVRWSPRRFAARDVVAAWVAAVQYGLRDPFDEPAQENEALWLHFARVAALLRAFGLGTPREFYAGRFLDARALAEFPRAAAALAHSSWRFAATAGDEDSSGIYAHDAAREMFAYLLQYRTEAASLLQFNSQVAVCGILGILVAMEVVDRATTGVAAALAEVDALLEAFIAPDGRSFLERDLIERFGLPEIDPREREEL